MEENRIACKNALDWYWYRVHYGRNLRPNSFAKWGNTKCMFRARDAARAIFEGRASARQIHYWAQHPAPSIDE
jgi:hypothetical protein